MNPAKIARFAHAQRYFICPKCGEALSLDEASLVCPNRHRYDIAKQGYVNLEPSAKQSLYYDRASFEQRHEILERGYYAHIAQAVLEQVRQARATAILDAGCGEGYYARAIAQDNPTRAVFACDIAKDCVQLAARYDQANTVRWFVANLADLPLHDGSMDCIVDIFSPANAVEFARVLAPSGVIIKVIPSADHDQQLREAAQEQLRNKTYDNHEVIEQFYDQYHVVHREHVSRTMAMPPEDIAAFAAMTPLLFNVDRTQLHLEGVRELTISADVLVGTV